MFPDTITIRLPDWVEPFTHSYGNDFSTPDLKMNFVLALAHESINRGSGGPFAAAIFDSTSNQLIAAGINLVTTQCCSSAHAEIVALSLAQQHLNRFDLSSGGSLHYELVTSTAPCAMCLGAIPWSGVTQLICGARDEDARSIGFDEGAKVADWISQLTLRGITVLFDVCRSEAINVLQSYKSGNGLIYNSKS